MHEMWKQFKEDYDSTDVKRIMRLKTKFARLESYSSGYAQLPKCRDEYCVQTDRSRSLNLRRQLYPVAERNRVEVTSVNPLLDGQVSFQHEEG